MEYYFKYDYDQKHVNFFIENMNLWYLFRYQNIISLGNETLFLISKAHDKENVINTQIFSMVYRNTWYWVLGCYEFTRKFDSENKNNKLEHIDSSCKKDLIDFKRVISKIRMPFAKNEFQYKSNSNALRSNTISKITDDFYYIIDGENFSFKQLFLSFEKAIIKLTSEGNKIND